MALRTRLRVLLDMDNGFLLPAADIDDGLALAMALGSPEAELAGVSTCGGNCRPPEAARATLAMLHAAGRSGIPVAVGVDAPPERDPHHAFLDAKRDGPLKALWAGAPAIPDNLPPRVIPAHELLVHLALEHEEPLNLVLLGSLTNLAMALDAEPSLAGRLGRVIHMGGVVADRDYAWSTPDIPDSAWADTLRFNTLYDAQASAAVFRAGLDLTIIPANVTSRVFLRPGHVSRLESGGVFQRFVAAGSRPWLEFSMRHRRLPGAHVHDPLALAALLEPGLLEYETLRVNLDKLAAGQGDFLEAGGNGPTVRTAVNVDAARAEDFIVQRLLAAR